MAEFWKVGEVADLTGLTIRTLRYYDQINLFSPSAYTDSGHRRYTREDLEKLQVIVMLKQMGMALEDIREIVLGRNHSVLTIMDNQIDRLREDIKKQQQLLNELVKTKAELPNKKHLSIKELKMFFELMKVNRAAFFSDSQLEQMKRHYEQINHADLEKMNQEFQSLLQQLRREKENGTSPKEKSIKDLAIRWKSIVYSFTQGDAELEKNVQAFHSHTPNNVLQFGMDAELYRYIRKALE